MDVTRRGFLGTAAVLPAAIKAFVSDAVPTEPTPAVEHTNLDAQPVEAKLSIEETGIDRALNEATRRYIAEHPMLIDGVFRRTSMLGFILH